MKTIEVSYGKTFNIGNYESIRIDLKATVDDLETYTDVYYTLRNTVHKLGETEKVNSKQQRK